MWKQHENDVEMTTVIVCRLISNCNPGKPGNNVISIWKQCGNDLKMTKVIISRLISSHNPGKPLMKHMETTKVMVSMLISSHNPGKLLIQMESAIAIYIIFVVPIKVDRLDDMLKITNFDHNKRKYLVQGFRQGFDIGYRGPMKHREILQRIYLLLWGLSRRCGKNL